MRAWKTFFARRSRVKNEVLDTITIGSTPVDLKGKNVIVLGAGISGQGAAELLTQRGAGKVWILGRPEEGVIDGSGAEGEELLKGADLLVKSPGIAWSHSLLQKAALLGTEVVGEADLACAFISIPLIVVTGTNGKTTTVGWLQEAFRRSGVEAGIGGNTGIPVSRLVEQASEWEVLILELSSFQLERPRYLHPQIGAVLNVSPSHGERYENFENYKAAKAGIASQMTSRDLLLVLSDGSFLPQDIRCRVEEVTVEKSPLSFHRFALKGNHHRSNAAFCAKILEEFARRHNRDENTLFSGMQETLDNFKGLPHRIEPVETSLKGRKIYNDSKSTNWQSVVAALEALEDEADPFFLILGGALRGKEQEISRDFLIALEKRVDKLFLYGEAGEVLKGQLSQKVSWRYTSSLRELCQYLYREGNFKTLLFSPGFPSFDQFENYGERGDAFKAAFL